MDTRCRRLAVIKSFANPRRLRAAPAADRFFLTLHAKKKQQQKKHKTKHRGPVRDLFTTTCRRVNGRHSLFPPPLPHTPPKKPSPPRLRSPGPFNYHLTLRGDLKTGPRCSPPPLPPPPPPPPRVSEIEIRRKSPQHALRQLVVGLACFCGALHKCVPRI